jgi:hypothetical protein
MIADYPQAGKSLKVGTGDSLTVLARRKMWLLVCAKALLAPQVFT